MRSLFLMVAALQLSFVRSPQSLTADQWRQDIDYFTSKLLKKHKNPFHTTSKAVFEKSIADLKAAAGTIPDNEVIVRLLQITAAVGDGHTYVHLPQSFKRYPVILYWFGNDLYASRTTPAYKHILGMKVKKIENMDIAEVRKKISAVLSKAENEWFDLNNSAAYMMLPDVLATLDIVSSVDKASFTFEDQNAREITVELVPVNQDGKNVWIGAARTEPLTRQQPMEKFWFSYLPELNAVYVNFRNYDELSSHCKKLFRFIDEKKASRLIVDLRQNGGGDFKKGRRNLIIPVSKLKNINQTGNLFVITGRRTFSAAMVNSIDFKKMTNAIIIGEPPGERPNSYSENDEMKLPNSKIVVSYSTRYYKFLDEDVPAFMPDVRVDLDWENYLAGIDPVMEKISSIILKK